MLPYSKTYNNATPISEIDTFVIVSKDTSAPMETDIQTTQNTKRKLSEFQSLDGRSDNDEISDTPPSKRTKPLEGNITADTTQFKERCTLFISYIDKVFSRDQPLQNAKNTYMASLNALADPSNLKEVMQKYCETMIELTNIAEAEIPQYHEFIATQIEIRETWYEQFLQEAEIDIELKTLFDKVNMTFLTPFSPGCPLSLQIEHYRILGIQAVIEGKLEEAIRYFEIGMTLDSELRINPEEDNQHIYFPLIYQNAMMAYFQNRDFYKVIDIYIKWYNGKKWDDGQRYFPDEICRVTALFSKQQSFADDSITKCPLIHYSHPYFLNSEFYYFAALAANALPTIEAPIAEIISTCFANAFYLRALYFEYFQYVPAASHFYSKAIKELPNCAIFYEARAQFKFRVYGRKECLTDFDKAIEHSESYERKIRIYKEKLKLQYYFKEFDAILLSTTEIQRLSPAEKIPLFAMLYQIIVLLLKEFSLATKKTLKIAFENFQNEDITTPQENLEIIETLVPEIFYFLVENINKAFENDQEERVDDYYTTYLNLFDKILRVFETMIFSPNEHHEKSCFGNWSIDRAYVSVITGFLQGSIIFKKINDTNRDVINYALFVKRAIRIKDSLEQWSIRDRSKLKGSGISLVILDLLFSHMELATSEIDVASQDLVLQESDGVVSELVEIEIEQSVEEDYEGSRLFLISFLDNPFSMMNGRDTLAELDERYVSEQNYFESKQFALLSLKLLNVLIEMDKEEKDAYKILNRTLLIFDKFIETYYKYLALIKLETMELGKIYKQFHTNNTLRSNLTMPLLKLMAFVRENAFYHVFARIQYYYDFLHQLHKHAETEQHPGFSAILNLKDPQRNRLMALLDKQRFSLTAIEMEHLRQQASAVPLTLFMGPMLIPFPLYPLKIAYDALLKVTTPVSNKNISTHTITLVYKDINQKLRIGHWQKRGSPSMPITHDRADESDELRVEKIEKGRGHLRRLTETTSNENKQRFFYYAEAEKAKPAQHTRHSEQHFFSQLNKMPMEKFIAEFKQQNPSFNNGAEIYLVLLDVYSKFSSCMHCMLAMIFEQVDPDGFVSKLAQHFITLHYSIATGKLQSAARIVAEKQYGTHLHANFNQDISNIAGEIKTLTGTEANVAIYQAIVPEPPPSVAYASGSSHTLTTRT